MKLISFIFILGLITCLQTDLPKPESTDKVKEDLMNRVKNALASAKTPANYSNLGTLYYRGTEVIADFLSSKDTKDKLKTYRLPKEIEGFILSRNYSDVQVIHSVSETLVKHSLVAVKKYENENGEFLYFVVIVGKTQVNKVQQFKTVETEECEHPWWCLGICKKCHTNYNQVPIPHTEEQMLTLMNAAHSLTDERIREKLVSGKDKIDLLPPVIKPVIKPENPEIIVIPKPEIPVIPTVTVPEVKIPEIKTPEIKIPEVKIPEITPVNPVITPVNPVVTPVVPIPQVVIPPIMY